MRNSSGSPIETYYASLWRDEPIMLETARRYSDQFAKTGISLSSMEARLVAFLIHQSRAHKFIEVGALTGASALWILNALPPDGHLWTLEKDPDHAEAARQVLAHDSRARVIEGDARETLKQLEPMGPFDGIFIDGNKAAYLDYLDWSEANLVKGSLILADNVFLGGSVLAAEGPSSGFSDKQVKIMQEFNRRLADPERYHSALIPTTEGLIAAIKKF